MIFSVRLCILTLSLCLQEIIFASMELNLTNFMKLRQKRSLTYDGGGSIKFSVAGIFPLYLEDKVNWRQLVCIASLQSQYQLPEKTLNPWDKWELPNGKSLQTTREEFDTTGYYRADSSRMFAYAALEEYMNRNGRNGRQCLLRSICENAQIDEHGDVYSRILDVVLTPGRDDLDAIYRDAMEAGKFGANCLSAYPKCPHGDNFLDRVSVVN